jgi:predicted transglutaminase-like cysteine proteinase
MDPRFFFENQDNGLPLQTGANHDEVALKSLQWVIQNITYTSDLAQFKNPEEWLFPAETLFLRKGDCEDGAILMANMMVKAGIPYWRIRLNAGDVWDGSGIPMTGGKIGHCWVTYLRESDNVWVILDWCYNAGIHKWKDAEDYFDIWFSFNRDFIFAQDRLDKP